MDLIKSLKNAGKAGLLSILLLASGCPKNKRYMDNNVAQAPGNGVQETSQEIEEEVPKDYFAEIPMCDSSGMALVSGDFNSDGYTDFILGSNSGGMDGNARLYFFENDGKGNFTLKRFYDKDIQRAK